MKKSRKIFIIFSLCFFWRLFTKNKPIIKEKQSHENTYKPSHFDGYHLNSSRTDYEICQDDHNNFEIFPSPIIVPFKKKVVVTMLTTEGSGVDWYFLNGLSMGYQLMHNIETKLDDDTEFAIIITEFISIKKRNSLIESGIRVILTNSIFFEGISDVHFDSWRYCFTKLRLFQLTFYETIVYYDIDMLFQKSPKEIFNDFLFVKFQTNQNYHFGAVIEIGKTQKRIFNGGMFIVEPSCFHFNKLVNLVHNTSSYDSESMEQGLLNWYFAHDTKKRESDITWSPIPSKYNVQWSMANNINSLEEGIAFHEKFWRDVVHESLFPKWRTAINTLLEHKKNDEYLKSLYPYIPKTLNGVKYITKEQIGKVAVLTLVNPNKKVHSTIVDSIKNEVKNTRIAHLTIETTKSSIFLELDELKKKMVGYDWIFVIDKNTAIIDNGISIYEIIGKEMYESSSEVDFILGYDCKKILNDNSFIIRNSKWSNDLLDMINENTSFEQLSKTNEFEFNDHFKSFSHHEESECSDGYQFNKKLLKNK